MNRVLLLSSLLLATLLSGFLGGSSFVFVKEAGQSNQKSQETVVFYSGAFDPPTVGHERIIEKLE